MHIFGYTFCTLHKKLKIKNLALQNTINPKNFAIYGLMTIV